MKNIFFLILVLLISCSPVCKKDIKSVISFPSEVMISEKFCKSINISNNYYLVISLQNITANVELEFLQKNHLSKTKYYDSDFDGYFPKEFIDKINPKELYFKLIRLHGLSWIINYSNGYLFVSRTVVMMD